MCVCAYEGCVCACGACGAHACVLMNVMCVHACVLMKVRCVHMCSCVYVCMCVHESHVCVCMCAHEGFVRVCARACARTCVLMKVTYLKEVLGCLLEKKHWSL